MAILSNNKITNPSLDFEGIKADLISHLQAQSQFTDYNFQGSALSVIIDLLAYNQYRQSLYTNLAVNESFLDSASKRNSVVSRANALGYVPQSATCASAQVNVTATLSAPLTQQLILPAGSSFTSNFNNQQYKFYTTSDELFTQVDPLHYTLTGINLTGGVPITTQFNVTGDTSQRFILQNSGIDISTISVSVQTASGASGSVVYTAASSLIGIDSTDSVYFIHELDDGLYELNFGNGVIGTALQAGNLITVTYMIAYVPDVNGATSFSYTGSALAGNPQIVTLTTSAAAGASYPEDIESIRFTAPRSFAAQNRAVTALDYQALIYAQMPGVRSVSVWGGENNDPPVYGKVFICVQPQGADKLTLQQKSFITGTILQDRQVATIVPVIVDPDKLMLDVNITAYYNPKSTTSSSSDLQALITAAVTGYSNTSLGRFESVFRYSQFCEMIDACDPSITNDITTVKLCRLVDPQFGVNANYAFSVVNPIYETGMPMGSVMSNGFYIEQDTANVYYIDDDGMGMLRLFYYNSAAQKVIFNPGIGTVDYATGTLSINGLNIRSLVESTFEIHLSPSSYDVTSAYNQIVTIDSQYLTVNVIADPTAGGDNRGGTAYIHATSRS